MFILLIEALSKLSDAGQRRSVLRCIDFSDEAYTPYRYCQQANGFRVREN
jgi:hypothetical protein